MRGCRPEIELRTIVAVRPRGSIEQADLLVRLPVEDAGWAATLPVTPQGETVTVTVGHPDLVPVSLATTCAHGYRIVGVASATRPIGSTIDILVPESLRLADPAWFDDLVHRAVRVFDLRLGPVQTVLAAQLALHIRPAS
jgi:hypothetical protein